MSHRSHNTLGRQHQSVRAASPSFPPLHRQHMRPNDIRTIPHCKHTGHFCRSGPLGCNVRPVSHTSSPHLRNNRRPAHHDLCGKRSTSRLLLHRNNRKHLARKHQGQSERDLESWSLRNVCSSSVCSLNSPIMRLTPQRLPVHLVDIGRVISRPPCPEEEEGD